MVEPIVGHDLHRGRHRLGLQVGVALLAPIGELQVVGGSWHAVRAWGEEPHGDAVHPRRPVVLDAVLIDVVPHEVTQRGAGAGAGKVTFNPFSITLNT